MLKELGLLAAILAPTATTLDIREPNRVNRVETYEVINATDKEIVLFQGYSDEDVYVAPKTRMNYTYPVNTEESFMVYLEKTTWAAKPNDLYYIYNAPDYEDPIPLTFSESTYNYYAEVGAYSPSVGLQIGRFEALQGIHAYLDQSKINKLALDNAQRDFDLLDDATATLVSSDTDITQNVNVSALRIQTNTASGSFYKTITITYNGQSTWYWVTNWVYPQPTPQPYLFFMYGFSNEVIFRSGTKSVKYGNMEGSLPFYFTDVNEGYVGMPTDEMISTTKDTLTSGFELVGLSLSLISSALGWYIFPGITIGLLLLIPIIVGLLVWLIRFLKKG